MDSYGFDERYQQTPGERFLCLQEVAPAPRKSGISFDEFTQMSKAELERVGLRCEEKTTTTTKANDEEGQYRVVTLNCSRRESFGPEITLKRTQTTGISYIKGPVDDKSYHFSWRGQVAIEGFQWRAYVTKSSPFGDRKLSLNRAEETGNPLAGGIYEIRNGRCRIGNRDVPGICGPVLEAVLASLHSLNIYLNEHDTDTTASF